MTPVALRIVNDVAYVTRINHENHCGRHSIWFRWRMTPVAPRIVNDVSYVTRVSHENHFLWQAQYLVTLEVTPVAPRIVNEVSYVTMVNHESFFAWQWQAQYLVMLEDDTCCSTHCK